MHNFAQQKKLMRGIFCHDCFLFGVDRKIWMINFCVSLSFRASPNTVLLAALCIISDSIQKGDGLDKIYIITNICVGALEYSKIKVEIFSTITILGPIRAIGTWWPRQPSKILSVNPIKLQHVLPASIPWKLWGGFQYYMMYCRCPTNEVKSGHGTLLCISIIL